MTGRDRQTVADTAVERCGNVEAIFRIVRHNHIPADTEVAGVEMADETVWHRKTAEYIQGQGFSPANVYESEPDVLTDDTGEVDIVTESEETIVQ